MSRRPPRIRDLRAAWWARHCLRDIRRGLDAGQIDVCKPPPPLPGAAVRGVEAVLRRSGATCLQAALVRQQWLRAHGEMRDVVIGVTAPKDGFAAHAWLAGAGEPAPAESWHELTRVPA